MMNKGLYIHIPFCHRVCTYCDFYKMQAKEEEKQRFVDYLIKELSMLPNIAIDTIFIGGGTPTNLNNALLEKLLVNLDKKYNLSTLKEFTIEANPNDITDELCELFNKYHINRISLGVQSLDDHKLALMGRTHTKKDVIKALKTLKKHQIDNINCDFIFGVVDEKYSKISKELKQVLKYVKHISLYSLILEEKTILFNKFQKGKFTPMDDDKESSLYYKLVHFLEKHHLKQYEISNFSMEGYQSLHNLTYWNCQPYFALGPSAASYIDNVRSTNYRNLNKYYQAIDNSTLPIEEGERLSIEEAMNEYIMLGLRKTEGISISKFDSLFHRDIFYQYPNFIKAIYDEVIVRDNDYLKIPQHKMYVNSEILLLVLGE